MCTHVCQKISIFTKRYKPKKLTKYGTKWQLFPYLNICESMSRAYVTKEKNKKFSFSKMLVQTIAMHNAGVESIDVELCSWV